MIRTLTTLAAFAFVLTVSVPAIAQQGGNANAEPDKDMVVARVNGAEIKQSDVAIAYARLPEQFRQAPINVIFPQIVQQLVDGELLNSAGRADDLQNSDEVKKQMAEFEKVAIQQTYMNRLIAQGIAEEDLRKVYTRPSPVRRDRSRSGRATSSWTMNRKAPTSSKRLRAALILRSSPASAPRDPARRVAATLVTTCAAPLWSHSPTRRLR